MPQKISKFGTRKVAITSSGLQCIYETKLGICHIVYIIPGDVSGHATECDVDRWLSTPTTVVSLVATTISTSQDDRPIYVSLGDESCRQAISSITSGEELANLGEEVTLIAIANLETMRSHNRYIFHSFDFPRILYPCADVDAKPRVKIDTDIPTATDANTNTAVDGDVDARYHFDVPKIWGGSSLQSVDEGVSDTR
ncbi:hypothetical protein PVK06_000888 [Gossypium arboreum]|uniref:Uncharacterized protein n=1 Tax=Gossypium arboreum TaxID=29729 RepID=A0ABR0R0V4_GOSAR|nr:hypothetical protein PVK06_000888 [Gossypium arboreum]